MKRTDLEILDFRSGLVDVERPNDDEVRLTGKVPKWNGDFLLDVLAHNLNVIFQLSRNGNDGSSLGDGAFNEPEINHRNGIDA